MRDNPEYAAARGIDQTRIRLTMLVISAIPSGIAGALYCIYFRVAEPEVFSFSTSTLILTMLLVGAPAASQVPRSRVLRFFPGGLAQISSNMFARLPKTAGTAQPADGID